MAIDSPLGPLLVALIAAILGLLIWKVSPFYRRQVMADGQSPARYPMLDGLRGQLALGVFAYHAYANYMIHRNHIGGEQNYNPYFVFLGTGGVAQFFLITGFLFWGKAIDKKVGPLDRYFSPAWRNVSPAIWRERLMDPLGHYYSRAWRIGPLFLTIAFVALVFVAVESHFAVHVPLLNLVGQVASFLSLGALATVPVNNIETIRFFGPAWTLRKEWSFYLILPFLAVLATPRRFGAICLGVFIASTIFYFTGHTKPLVNNRHFAMFLVGMAAAHLVRHYPAIPVLKSRWVSLLIIAAAVLAAYVRDLNPLWLLLHGLIFIPIVYGNSMFGLLATRSFRTLGLISYSIYLLHGPIIQAFVANLVYYDILNRLSPAEYWCWVGGLTIPLVGLCALTYRFIEHPHLHKRLVKRPIREPQGFPVEALGTDGSTSKEAISA